MDAAIDDYNQGEKTYEAAKAVLETIERSGICDTSDVREKYNALDELSSSKNSYNFGNEYIANGDYENAIIQYGQVSSKDTNYDAAQPVSYTHLDVYKRQHAFEFASCFFT